MDATRSTIETLAVRIERAYALRGPQWNPGCSAPGVWDAAAAGLLRLHRAEPEVPLDPELFVAAQVGAATFVDPWSELTQATAARRYRGRIRDIVAALRAELRGELRQAARRLRQGEGLASIVLTSRPGLSPLGRYIIATRARRDDLAARLQAEAADQHRSCPLYRQASLPLIARDAYPVSDSQPDHGFLPHATLPDPHAAWN